MWSTAGGFVWQKREINKDKEKPWKLDVRTKAAAAVRGGFLLSKLSAS